MRARRAERADVTFGGQICYGVSASQGDTNFGDWCVCVSVGAGVGAGASVCARARLCACPKHSRAGFLGLRGERAISAERSARRKRVCVCVCEKGRGRQGEGREAGRKALSIQNVGEMQTRTVGPRTVDLGRKITCVCLGRKITCVCLGRKITCVCCTISWDAKTDKK